MFADKEIYDRIIEISSKLGFELIIISVNELQFKFEQWIDIFLHSVGCDPKSIFEWFHKLHAKSSELGEQNIENIKTYILNSIEDLVNLDSIKAGEVIDTWLPNSHQEVIENLTPNPKLQLKYLQDFLNERENDIKECILSLNKDNRKEDTCQYK